jgi:hypothetical protein
MRELKKQQCCVARAKSVSRIPADSVNCNIKSTPLNIHDANVILFGAKKGQNKAPAGRKDSRQKGRMEGRNREETERKR